MVCWKRCGGQRSFPDGLAALVLPAWRGWLAAVCSHPARG